MGSEFGAGIARGQSKETNNYPQGKSGSKADYKRGPAAGGSTSGNPTSGGGINRPTRGKGAQK